MSYASTADVIAELDDRLLIRLTDDAGSGTVDSAVIQIFLDKATDLINGKVGMRYPLPFTTPPQICKSWCADIAVYLMLGRRQESPGDIWQSRYDNAVRDVDRVATGALSLGVDDPQDTGNRQPVVFSGTDRVFTRAKMGGW